MNQTLDSALRYVKRGWHVFPVLYKGKTPITSNGVKDATDDVAQILKWFSSQSVNIGVRTGQVSGIVVVDIDADKLSDEARKLVAALPPTFTVKTGRAAGGTHYYYKAPSDLINNRAGVLPGIDIRGENGYVVGAPSLHESGNYYEIVNDIEPVELPLWLLLLIQPSRPAPLVNVGPSTDSPSGLARFTTNFLLWGAPDGQWNISIYKAARDWHQQGGSQESFIKAATKTAQDFQGALDHTDLRTIEQAFKTAPKHEPREVVEDRPDNSAAEIATQFLLESGYNEILKCWQKDFFVWRKNKYVELPRAELHAELIQWLHLNDELRKKSTSKFIADLTLNIAGLTGISTTKPVPFWLNNRDVEVIAMANGLLRVDSLATTPELLPHTPDYFNFACNTYNYEPDAKAPTWDKFLRETQPDQEIRDLLQEWFGYNCVFDTSYEKFALFEGKGANGKTVCCTVLRELLGRENTSHIALEAFNASRTFPLAATAGKLANIVEEMNEIDKAQEGVLKQFVSGGAFTVERKHRDPFSLIATARLTFATNILPRFSDRSQGLWRRLLHIPFRNQLLNEQDQDKRLASGNWWTSSGELSGVFNWAIEGLKRLRARGYFTEPKQLIELKEEYKLEMNPAKAFLQDFYSFDTTQPTGTPKVEVYKAYRTWMIEQGNNPLSATMFNREVLRTFPDTKDTQVGVKRTRHWACLRPLGEASADVLSLKRIK